MKRRFDNQDIYLEVVVKIARIEEINQGESCAIIKYKDGEAEVFMKEYILNDLKAFEKKWKMRNITPIKFSEEASNGSSIHVDLKTSA